ncbi:hypothetical protein [Bacillus sp. FSL K6-3431]|uniref:hypothetical protein n=1 Tax=Bacillus sp. FSL K6-3431 TaxID=2921500 RepID=UPI0030FB44B7
MAILAYPSDSAAFYLAVFFSVCTIAVKTKRQQIDVLAFLDSFIYVFLIASFTYEFIQIVWNNNTYSIAYMVFLTLLIIGFLFARDRIATNTLIFIMLICWAVGSLGLTFIMPFIMVFGYTIAPWFLGLFMISCLTLLILKQRKKVS